MSWTWTLTIMFHLFSYQLFWTLKAEILFITIEALLLWTSIPNRRLNFGIFLNIGWKYPKIEKKKKKIGPFYILLHCQFITWLIFNKFMLKPIGYSLMVLMQHKLISLVLHTLSYSQNRVFSKKKKRIL